MKNLGKLLSAGLCVCMCVGMLASPVYAADSDTANKSEAELNGAAQTVSVMGDVSVIGDVSTMGTVSEDQLPEPYDLVEPVQGLNYEFETASGEKVSYSDNIGKKTLLIFGRPTCGNTMGFVNGISSWAEYLNKKGIKVYVVFESKEQVEQDNNIPFECVYDANGTSGMWKIVRQLGLGSSITYPLILVQDGNDYIRYYSTGYVSEPEKVIATLLQDFNSTPSSHEHEWGSYSVVKEATALAKGSKVRSCKVCGQKDTKTIPKLKASIKLSAKSKTIKKKNSYTLKISGLAKGDSVKSVKTSKKSVATVKKLKKNQYKITGKKKGKATITVTLKSGKKASCKVSVK